jgi:hypothetical protein
MNFYESDDSLSSPKKLAGGAMSQHFQKNHDPEEVKDGGEILSRMNSMECWDYSIELECLDGPPGYILYHSISAINRAIRAL